MKKIEHHIHNGEHFEQENKYKKDQELKEIETKKSDTAVQFVHPQTWAQRNRVQKRRHFRCSNVLALSSKCGHYVPSRLTTLNMPGPYSKWLKDAFQIKKKELTDLGIIHRIPNTVKASHHKAWENLQWRRRWSTDSPSQQHKQHIW